MQHPVHGVAEDRVALDAVEMLAPVAGDQPRDAPAQDRILAVGDDVAQGLLACERRRRQG
jgi:hypothetical protein